jgi:hypothetical protein
MSLLVGFVLAVVIVIGGLILFAKVARSTANQLDRFAKALRTWADNKENNR